MYISKNKDRISRIKAFSEMRQEGVEIYKNREVVPIPSGHCSVGDQCYMVKGYRSEAWYLVCDNRCNCSGIDDLCEHIFAVEEYEGEQAAAWELECDFIMETR